MVNKATERGLIAQATENLTPREWPVVPTVNGTPMAASVFCVFARPSHLLSTGSRRWALRQGEYSHPWCRVHFPGMWKEGCSPSKVKFLEIQSLFCTR